MPLPPRVDDHGIRGIVQGLQVDAAHHQLERSPVPRVDVQGHGARVRMGQPDAVARGQRGLQAQGTGAQVPAPMRRAFCARGNWDQ